MGRIYTYIGEYVEALSRVIPTRPGCLKAICQVRVEHLSWTCFDRTKNTDLSDLPEDDDQDMEQHAVASGSTQHAPQTSYRNGQEASGAQQFQSISYHALIYLQLQPGSNLMH